MDALVFPKYLNLFEELQTEVLSQGSDLDRRLFSLTSHAALRSYPYGQKPTWNAKIYFPSCPLI